MRKLTQEEAKVYYSTDKLKLVGKYINSTTQTEYECLCGLKNCVRSLLIVPSKVKAGRIKSCRKGIKYRFNTQEDASEYFSMPNLKMIGKYIDANTPVQYECLWNLPGCKHKCNIIPHNVKRRNTISCGCSRNHRCMKDVSYQYYQIIENGAKKRNINFDLTIEYLQKLLEKQEYKCALSGISIILSRTFDSSRKKYTSQTGSLDRIDSDKGYIKGNVQWVHKDVNFMKRNYKQEYFLDMCNKIVKYNFKD